MITQYSNNGSYSLPSSTVTNYFKNYIMPTDSYIIMQTGQYTWSCVIDRVVGNDYIIRVTLSLIHI